MILVVGAAILRGDRVLAARRTTPAAMAGRWEFPGGKVEPGEQAEGALVREIGEELGCTVEVTGWLDGAVPITQHHQLRVATAVLVSGEPEPTEHDAVRWLAADELDALDWLDPDRPFLTELANRLRGPLPSTTVQVSQLRGIFFEEDLARTAAARLVRDGYDATVLRERLAGEDDEEAHPWAVVTDAPSFALELLVDEYDGWLDPGDPGDAGEPRSAPAVPLDLPPHLGGSSGVTSVEV